jgi:hypothetical protein
MVPLPMRVRTRSAILCAQVLLRSEPLGSYGCAYDSWLGYTRLNPAKPGYTACPPYFVTPFPGAAYNADTIKAS